MPSNKLRVLRISHTPALPAYRERERSLVRTGEIEVALIKPVQWPHLGAGGEDQQEEFLMRDSKVFLPGNIPLFAFAPEPLISTLKSFQPDVVDIHEEPYSVSGFQSMFLASRHVPQAACVFYSAQNIVKRYPPPFCWTEKWVYARAQGAYPCSLSVQETLRQKGFDKPADVVPLGVNPAIFSESAPPMSITHDADSFVIGFTGRLEEYKGLGVLIRALAKLKESRRIKPVLLVAGGGSATGVMKLLASQLGVSSDITWLGELKAEQMPSFYTTCNVIAVPSLSTPTWKEQFGRVPVEAMACGIPVISSDSGSLQEVVGDVGICAPEGDVNGLAASIERFATDETFRARSIALGRTKVARVYTWDAIAQQKLALYRNAVAAKSRRAAAHPVKA